MRKILLIGIMLILIQSVYAANVGVVVEFPDSTIHKQCVSVDEGSNGYDILEATTLDILWSNHGTYGYALCKINNIGDEVAGTSCAWGDKYWAFYTTDNNAWSYSFVGVSSYVVVNGDVLGFVYSGSDEFWQPLVTPTFFSHETVCPNKLELKEIKVYVNGDKESADENGGEIDVEPDSKIKMKIELENLYSIFENVEIRNIEIKGVIKGIDDGEDIEEEADDFDLDAGKDETVELEFDIPLNVDEDKYDLKLTIKGKDENNLEYEHTIDFTVDVKKEKHNVIFRRAELDNEHLSCSRTTELGVEIVNIGDEEEEVALEIKNQELGIDIREKGIALDSDPFKDDNKYNKYYTITVDDEQKEGTYPLSIKAVYDEDKKEEKINLRVSDCDRAQTSAQTQQSPGTTEQSAESASAAAQQQEQTEAAEQLKKEEKSTLIKERTTIALVGLADLAIIITGILLFVKFLRK